MEYNKKTLEFSNFIKKKKINKMSGVEDKVLISSNNGESHCFTERSSNMNSLEVELKEG